MNEIHVLVCNGNGGSAAGYAKGYTSLKAILDDANMGLRWLTLRDPNDSGREQLVSLLTAFTIEEHAAS